MPVARSMHGISCGGHALSLGQFPMKVQQHMLRVPNTELIEQHGERVRRLEGDADLPAFIREVCRWGGQAGNATRILKSNPIEEIERQFTAAISTLDASAPSPPLQDAVKHLSQLDQLGAPSIASMHLRFLRPDRCAVLDPPIAAELVYDFTSEGFAQYSHDCGEIARSLMTAGIQNPRREDGTWLIADVDMALTVLICGW